MGGGDFRQIDVSLIDVPEDRARRADPAKAEAIGATIRAVRQFHPITVTPTSDGRFTLVDGLHRLTGAKMVGLDALNAHVVNLSPQEQRKQEILSNIVRADMDALSRARSIVALCDLLMHQDGRRRRGRPSKQDIENQAKEISALGRTNFGWTDEAQAALGLQRRPLFEYLRVGRHIPSDVASDLANTPVANNLKALLKLSELEEGELRAVAAAYNSGSFQSVDDARQSLSGNPVKAAKTDTGFDRVATAFRRLTKAQKTRLLLEVIGQDEHVPEAVRRAITELDADA